MSDILDIVKEHGLPTALGAVASGLGGKALWTQKDIKTRVQALEEKMETVHDGCHFPKEVLDKILSDVDALKLENTKFEVKLGEVFKSIDRIEEALKSNSSKQDDTNSKIDKIIGFLEGKK